METFVQESVASNSCVQEFPAPVVAVGDRDWQEVCAIFRERNQLAGPVRDLTARGVEKIAALYEREESRWGEFLSEHGVERPRRGPQARSRFHGIARYLLGLGVGGDKTGMASVLAANLDAWLESRVSIRPAQIPAWIEAEGGVRAIYDTRKGAGNPAPSDEKHYWVTPPDRMAKLNATYNFDFDTCPHPRPEGFDGLKMEWGKRNWCNPPFQDFGPWIAKAWEECRNGNLTVMVVPIYRNGDIARLDAAGAEISYWGVPRWLAIEDGTPNPKPIGQCQPCVLVVFRPKIVVPNEVEASRVRAQVVEIKQWQSEKLAARVEP